MAVLQLSAELTVVYELCIFEVETQQFSELINADAELCTCALVCASRI